MASPRKGCIASVAAAVISAATARSASACGVSTADGLSACSLSEHEEETRPRWHAGASGIYTSTAIRFSDSMRGDETRSAVVGSLAYHPTARTSYQIAAGGTFGGRLVTPEGNQDFSPGVTAAVGASWRVVDQSHPFVVLTGNLSFSAAHTTLMSANGAAAAPSVGYQAFDLRLGVLVGTTIARVFSPYAVGRAFGGPIYWRYQGSDVTGTDTHHYQFGAGVTLVIARRVNLFAEGIPLGERSLAAGGALAF
ncbi:MAG TPA: hypothetical protein VFH68_00825 [Polyangia bacterium]|nr:hypothetical protein [Polyangia bacterium]